MAKLTMELKHAISAQLRLGKSPKEVSEHLEVNLSAVYILKRQLEAARDAEEVQELVTLPTELVSHIVQETKKVAGATTTEQLDAVVTGLDGLKLLDRAFQTTIGKVLARFDAIADDEFTELKDLKLIIDTSANAHEKLFSSGTNIHIGDNNSHSSQQLTVFKNKQGV